MLFSYCSVWLNCAKLTVSDQLVSVTSLKVLPFKLFLLNSLCFIYFWWILIYSTLPLLYQESPIEIKNLFSKEGQEFIKSSSFFFFFGRSFVLTRPGFIYLFLFQVSQFCFDLRGSVSKCVIMIIIRRNRETDDSGNTVPAMCVTLIVHRHSHSFLRACVRVLSVLGKRDDYQRRRSQEQ